MYGFVKVGPPWLRGGPGPRRASGAAAATEKQYFKDFCLYTAPTPQTGLSRYHA